MGEVVPPSEERLSLALQGIDQLLGELEVHLTSYDMSRDCPKATFNLWTTTNSSRRSRSSYAVELTA